MLKSSFVVTPNTNTRRRQWEHSSMGISKEIYGTWMVSLLLLLPNAHITQFKLMQTKRGRARERERKNDDKSTNPFWNTFKIMKHLGRK